MSDLAVAIQGLFEFLRKLDGPPPAEEVRIVEIRSDAALDDRGRLRVRRDTLLKIDDYRERFEELLHSHLAWINVSCYGMDHGTMIIGIELPRAAATRTVGTTSLNYSGPSAAVRARGWDVEPVLALE